MRRQFKTYTRQKKHLRDVLTAIAILATSQLATITIAAAEEVALDEIIAVVNDDIILSSEFVRERNAMILQNQSGLPKGDALDKMVVEQLIIRSIQLQEAERRNIRIDESGLQRAIEDMARNNNMTVIQLREQVTRDGMDFLQFREDLRKNLTVSTLTRREIDSKLYVTDAEVEEVLSVERTNDGEFSYTLEHILITLPQQADALQDQSAKRVAQTIASRARDGESFSTLVRQERINGTDIEGGNLGSRNISDMPELFAQQMPGMQQGDITEPLRSAAGYHILKLVAKTTVSQATPSQVRARHILVSTRSGRTNTAAQARIREVQQQLSGGAAFTDVAREYSDDKSSAAKGGDLGWFGTGEMVSEFEQIAFSTPVNVVSQPFKTAFGWHMLEVLEQEMPENSNNAQFSKTRDQIRQQKGEESYNAWLKTLRDNAYVELRGFAEAFQ